MVKGLFTSSSSKRQIDLKLDSAVLMPPHLSLDATVSCLLLPSWLTATAASAAAPLQTRAAEKIAKHAAECSAMGRVFFPFVSDTLGGIGPPPFVVWLKHVYAAVARRQRAEGGDRAAAAFALESLLAELCAVLVKDNVTMIERLTIRDAA